MTLSKRCIAQQLSNLITRKIPLHQHRDLYNLINHTPGDALEVPLEVPLEDNIFNYIKSCTDTQYRSLTHKIIDLIYSNSIQNFKYIPEVNKHD